MSRLLAFGCSNTYGQGLTDCYHSNGAISSVHSNFAWPSVVANELGLTLSNQSDPGASNKQIWNQILSNDFNSTDTVIILWSYFDRWCVFHKDKSLTKIGVWASNKITKQYYKNLHNDFDNGLDFWLRINHIYTFLENIGIQQYHLTCQNIKNLGPKEPKWSTAKITPVYLFNIKQKYPKALDGKHPNEDAHREFGIQLINYIQKYK